MEGLYRQWKRTGRSLTMHNESISFDELRRQLIELEGPEVADHMEVDALRNQDHTRNMIKPVMNEQNRVNFDAVNSIPAFIEAFKALSKSRNLRIQMESILRQSNSARNQSNSFAHNSWRSTHWKRRGMRHRGGSRQPYHSRQIRAVDVPEEEQAEAEDENEVIFAANTIATVEEQVHGTQPVNWAMQPLMYLRARMNDVPMDALVETGAGSRFSHSPKRRR